MDDFNLGGSFIIASFLLLTTMSMFLNFNTQNDEILSARYASTSAVGVNDLITYDFEKIGYRVNTSPKVLEVSEKKIKFLADLENNGIIDTITYEAQFIEGDSAVIRRVANISYTDTIIIFAKDLKITGYNIIKIDSTMIGKHSYYNTGEAQTKNLNKIGAIGISFTMEFPNMKTNPDYPTVYYINKKVYPRNLKFIPVGFKTR